MKRRLIKSVAVLTMDNKAPFFGCADILVQDGRIAAIGPDLPCENAEIIEGQGMLAIPGLINAHVHLWQTLLRGIGGNWAGNDYFRFAHSALAPRYTSEDMHLATLTGAFGQLHGGVTTVFDWCHNNRTPEHSDAAIDALSESGIRAIFGHGTVKTPPEPGKPHFSEIPHPAAELERVAGRVASNPLVGVAMCMLGPDYSTLDVCRADFALARDLRLLSSAHVWGRSNRLVTGGYRKLAEEGLIAPGHNVVHGNFLLDDEIALLIAHGASITATPQAELQGYPARPLIGRVEALGGRASIGNDSELMQSGDMFSTLRHALQVERLFAYQTILSDQGDVDGEAKAEVGTGGAFAEKIPVTTMQALRWATLDNAHAMGMAHEIGSLETGKRADIILMRFDGPDIAPALNPVDAVTMFAGPAHVDTVLVNGEIRKQAGRLVAAQASGAAQRATSRGRTLLREAGLTGLSEIPQCLDFDQAE